MTFLVYGKTESLRRLFLSWINPGPKQRRLPEDVEIMKLNSPRTILLSESDYTRRLVLDLLERYLSDVQAFYVKEISSQELRERIEGMAELDVGEREELL